IQIYSYQDKFRALPGDDKAATADGNGNGLIEGAWNAASGEAFNFWQHIRKAGLATGSTNTGDVNYTPKNTEGGRIGVQSNPNNTIANMSGSYAVCSDGVLGKFAKQLDTSLDDGDTATGNLMAASLVSGTAATTAVATSSISDSTKYTVCMAF
ncbi:MAG: prepilin-type cleavage/methylation domain-containing protein, partial [Methylophilaceae bacterium]|nr:prepilin-type cleavage/methylation domain-containing protein [Methylophilaceae bacterium]